ncbi:MAG: hypothetical protein HRU26_00860 [Psychroserpens sp.]|nr:hypothetical protein [Psychroserpens sp.]
MVEKLVAYQIYYSEETKNNCFTSHDWWNLYDNTNALTPFFENTPIANLIESGAHKTSEYFAVFSHDIMHEIAFKENNKVFNPVNLRDSIGYYDVYSFQKRRRQENIVIQADNYHPGFTDITKKILSKVGYELPNKIDRIILFNHFIMKSELYERYYNEMLKPAMEVMSEMDELNKDAGYHKFKKNKIDFTSQLGYPHYPYHPFICERLPSIWLQHNKDLSFSHIF